MQSRTELTSQTRKLRTWIAALIVLSTLLFILGTAMERASAEVHTEGSNAANSATTASATAVPSAPVTGEGSEGSTEGQEGGATGAHSEGTSSTPATPPSSTDQGTEGSSAQAEQAEATHREAETVMGIDIENPLVITAIVIGWLALVAGLFLLGRGGFVPVLLLIALAAVVAFVFDLGEVSLQLGRGDTGLVMLAVLVALTHAAVALLVLLALRQARRPAASGVA